MMEKYKTNNNNNSNINNNNNNNKKDPINISKLSRVAINMFFSIWIERQKN